MSATVGNTGNFLYDMRDHIAQFLAIIAGAVAMLSCFVSFGLTFKVIGAVLTTVIGTLFAMCVVESGVRRLISWATGRTA